MKPYTEINTSEIQPVIPSNDLYTNRTMMAEETSLNKPEVTIIVQAYKNLDQVKRCVDSVLRFTQGIDYELLLIDNGSNNGTTEYYQSVPYPQKRILRITHNRGSGIPLIYIPLSEIGRFYCALPEDMICTPRWLENMLTCIKSDPKIGMVNPMTNNMENYQSLNFYYSSFLEMWEMAEKLNVPDPRLWEERLWVSTVGTLFRKEVLLAKSGLIADSGFAHMCADTDICFACRRAGYRIILARDVWMCHDDPEIWKDRNETFRKNYRLGKETFFQKYGIRVKETTNFIIPYLEFLPAPGKKDACRVLGVNVCCGQPILDVKNWLRSHGVFDTSLSAISEDYRYCTDLMTICDGKIVCRETVEAAAEFSPSSFDYIVCNQPINQFPYPEKTIQILFNLCKPGGYILCKLRNTASFRAFAYLLGREDVYDKKQSWNMLPESAEKILNQYGSITEKLVSRFGLEKAREMMLSVARPRGCSEEDTAKLLERAKSTKKILWDGDEELLQEMLLEEPTPEQWEKLVDRMLIQDYVYIVRKNTIS